MNNLGADLKEVHDKIDQLIESNSKMEQAYKDWVQLHGRKDVAGALYYKFDTGSIVWIVTEWSEPGRNVEKMTIFGPCTVTDFGKGWHNNTPDMITYECAVYQQDAKGSYKRWVSVFEDRMFHTKGEAEQVVKALGLPVIFYDCHKVSEPEIDGTDYLHTPGKGNIVVNC